MTQQPHGVHGVLVTVGSRKLDDSEVHYELSVVSGQWSGVRSQSWSWDRQGPRTTDHGQLTRFSFNLKFVIFDHRIAQEAMAGFVQRFPGGFFVRSIQLNFQIFANVNG